MTGQIVVYAAIVAVTTLVSVCNSGWAGQLMTVAAQLTTVETTVVNTVEVVSLAGELETLAGPAAELEISDPGPSVTEALELT